VNRILLRATLLAATAGILVVLAVFGALEWHDLSATATASAAQQAASVADAVSATEARPTGTKSTVGPSVAVGPDPAAGPGDVDLIRTAIGRTDGGSRGDLGVHLADGRTVGAVRASQDQVDRATRGVGPSRVSVSGGDVLLNPVRGPDGSVAVVEAYLPRWDVIGAWAPRMAIMLAAGLVAIGVAALVGHHRTRPMVRSVRAISAAATLIGQGRTGVEIPLGGAGEVTRLIGTLNLISVRVEQLIASEHEFVADLSHRLRTPLTALRLDSESIGDGPVAERVRHAVMALENDVDDLIRTAARVTRLAPATCDAAEVVRERMAFWSTMAEHQGRSCELRCGDGEALIGLPDKEVGAVVDALLGNVFQHTEAGIPFAATVVRYAGWVTLVVEDGGPGIVDTEAALRRGASGHGSTGLGLDIARHAVEATGGTVHVDRGRLGGARIRLRFAEAGSHHDDPAPRAWRLWSRSADLPAVEPGQTS
jgi:signal transduction histidine kinase